MDLVQVSFIAAIAHIHRERDRNVTSDKGGGKCVWPRLSECLSVCLSVCLLAKLLKNACMDLDEILRVDRCRDTDELVNF